MKIGPNKHSYERHRLKVDNIISIQRKIYMYTKTKFFFIMFLGESMVAIKLEKFQSLVWLNRRYLDSFIFSHHHILAPFEN